MMEKYQLSTFTEYLEEFIVAVVEYRDINPNAVEEKRKALVEYMADIFEVEGELKVCKSNHDALRIQLGDGRPYRERKKLTCPECGERLGV